MKSTSRIFILLLSISVCIFYSCNDKTTAEKTESIAINPPTKIDFKKENQNLETKERNKDSLKSNSNRVENQSKVKSNHSVISNSQKLDKEKKGLNDKVLKEKVTKKRYSKIEFETKEFDFGEIIEGDTVIHNFSFVNVGKGPLEVLSTKATCGCTQPSFPFIELGRGETGKIGVRYISIGKNGAQEATITVKTNGLNSPVELKIFGVVNEKSDK